MCWGGVGGPTPPRWPEPASPCHGGRGEGGCKRQLSGRRLMTEGKSDCEAYLALRWVPGWLLGWTQLVSTLSHPTSRAACGLQPV